MWRPVGRLTVWHLKGGMVGVSRSPHGTGSTGSLHITLGVEELHPFVLHRPSTIEGLGG